MDALDLLDREAAALGVALHSVELTVAGETVLSAGSGPLGVQSPHRMYSIAKTVTGFAVGLLAAEGGLSLDDPVSGHFPELGPCHPWLEQTTLRNVLAMLGPHASTTFKGSDDAWLESYFRVPPAYPPGTVFAYDTSGAYVLAALVERTAGTSLVDYLRPRLLDPLGISDDFRVRPGPEPISHGGSGLVCRPRDLLRLAHLLLDGGVHDGETLLPADYLREATTVHADTALQTWGTPFRGGYGYQLWLPERGGYLMYGLGGQIVYCEPEHRLALVVTADAQACQSGDQRLAGLVFRHLVDPLVGGPGRAAARTTSSGERRLEWPTPRNRPENAVELRDDYTPCAAGTWPTDLQLDVGADGGSLGSPSDGWRLDLAVGAARPQRFGPDGRPVVVTAGWAAPRTLDVVSWFVDDELAVIRLRLHAGPDGTLTVRSQGFGERFDPRWSFARAFSPSPSPAVRP